MARRAIWKGVVTFGKIRVPVKLYSAVESVQVSFHLLHATDKVRLRQQLVCELEKEPVPDEEIVKGLEIGEHEYVLVEPGELAELEPESDRNIEVLGFTDAATIDPRYYDRPYHLAPDGEEHKYAALAEAIHRSGKVAVCHWTFRKRSYNGVIRAQEGALEVTTLRNADEVTAVGELDLPQVDLTQKELKTARYLIQELSDKFEPIRYHNEFREQLRDLVKTKAEGGEIEAREVPAPEPTESKDLMKLLEASLKEARKRKQDKWKETVH